MVFGCEGESVCPIDGPQSSVCQNRLRTDDDLSREITPQFKKTYFEVTVSRSSVVLHTLLTRDITANMAASVITVVSMPAFDRLVAISCPWWKEEDKYYNYILSSKSTFSCFISMSTDFLVY